jgi:monofunctional biosynthetic peptidoglycan transglycosylase
MNLDGPMLFDFSDASTLARWRGVHDRVMGGVSDGRMAATDDGTAVFEGVVRLENDGGFASVRTEDTPFDLSGSDGIALHARGDGQIYKLGLRLDGRFDGITYRAAFRASDGEWRTHRVAFEEFTPRWRGRLVADAPALDPSSIRSVGLLISDKQAGPFRLELAWMAAYGDERTVPRE